MMASDNIISVSEDDFEYQVLEFSKQVPVVVDFWAEWCGPCKSLGPILERFTAEAKGAFRLAKVDVDQNPNLALKYSVRSIPSVKAFRDGQLVAEFGGLQPESKIREFLLKLSPSEHDLILEKGLGLLDHEAWQDAESHFREFLKKNPNNPAGLLGLVRSLLVQGFIEEPSRIIKAFPPSKEYNSVQVLQPLVKALIESKEFPSYSEDLLEAAYMNGIRLIKMGNFEAAMDGLLDIIRQDKRYRDDGVRKIMLGIFEVLGANNTLTRQYRNELALVLF